MKHEQFCPGCEEYRETKVVEREETYTVRGRKIAVPVKIGLCSHCGESIGSDETDQEILDTVHAEYRQQVDLLTPERIKEIRKRYRLSQRSFAALLGMSQATINQYERGGLQDQAHDTAIRACEKPEFMRELLERRGQWLSDWQQKRAETALAGEAEPASEVLDSLGEIDWICMLREVSDRTGFRKFEYKRFASVVLWLCDKLGEASRTTINKLIFYADFLNFKTATVSLTGTAYRRVKFGPVPADFDGLLSRMESEDLLVREDREFSEGYVGHYYRPGPTADSLHIEFSDHELRVLERVRQSLGTMTAKAISEKSHRELAWIDTEDGQIISYQTAQALSLSLPD